MADSVEEQHMIAAWRGNHLGHVFALEASTDFGASFHDLGPREEACRVAVNITFEIRDQSLRLISNLANTPFELDGEGYASVEGFWQSLKFEAGTAREAVKQLWGVEAKRAGAMVPEPAYITLAGQTFQSGGSDHRALMYRACHAKFHCNVAAREALLSTGERPLTHRVRRDSKTIPGVLLADFWMRIRRELRERC